MVTHTELYRDDIDDEIPTYIINMPVRTERRAAMEALMQRIGIRSYVFVEPVPKDALPDGAYPALPPAYASLNATVTHKIFPMHARTYGHGSMVSKVSHKALLVFEDDAIERVPPASVLPHISSILRVVPDDWDVVYLEYCMESCSSSNTQSPVVPANQPYCTAAMLYNTAKLDRIARCVMDQGQLIDFSYAACIRAGSLRAYVSRPTLFAQDASYGAGDLSHMHPGNVQWWLNIVMRMYPDAGAGGASRPRLPACWNSREMLGFVRWANVLGIALVLATIGYIGYQYLSRTKSRKSLQSTSKSLKKN
jgi:hypothetical protein